MQLANRLPIHAVLFRTAVVAAAPALRMDEALEQFERTSGVVAVVTGEGASKSRELADALAAGKKEKDLLIG